MHSADDPTFRKTLSEGASRAGAKVGVTGKNAIEPCKGQTDICRRPSIVDLGHGANYALVAAADSRDGGSFQEAARAKHHQKGRTGGRDRRRSSIKKKKKNTQFRSQPLKGDHFFTGTGPCTCVTLKTKITVWNVGLRKGNGIRSPSHWQYVRLAAVADMEKGVFQVAAPTEMAYFRAAKQVGGDNAKQ